MNSFTFPGFPSEQISRFISTVTEWFKPNRWLIWDLTRTLAISLLALLAVILLKKSTLRISTQIQTQPLIAWGAGIFVALVTPFLALILIITICLLPIGLLLLLALALSYLFGWLALGIVMGRLVNQRLQTHWSDESQAFLGSLILGVITSIIGWIPCIGWVFNVMLGSIGLGAVIITRFGVLAPQGNATSDSIIPINKSPQSSEIKPSAEESRKTGTKLKK